MIVTVAIILIVCAAVGGVVFGAFVRGASAPKEQEKLDETASSWQRQELPRAGVNQDPAPQSEHRTDYVGLQANDLISDFGTPTQRYSRHDGTTMWFYQWDDQWAEFRVNTAGYIIAQRREVGYRD